jgi:hypothetical protein
LEQGSPKRNADARVKAGDPPVSRGQPGLKCDLFDRNREPSDQPRNLVQPLGILRLYGLRKPDEAFVIAHLGHVAWYDRRHRPHESAQEIWHRIASMARTGLPELGRALSLFGARFVARGSRGVSGEVPDRNFCIAEIGEKSLPRSEFRPLIDTAPELPISSFASLGGFVIRSVANALSPIPR